MRKVTSRGILGHTLTGFLRTLVSGKPDLKRQVRTDLWLLLKSYGADNVRSIDIRELEIGEIRVRGSVNSLNALILAALCRKRNCRTFFEIGTYLGEAVWTVAHNNPQAKLYTLDLPSPGSESTVGLELTDKHLFERWDRGLAFLGTPEGDRITQLFGDSAEFDFTPYRESMDLVFIDGSHSYSYVESDTKAALSMLSPTGTIAWHDFPAYPGVVVYLNELGKSSDRPIMHVRGTGLTVYMRQASVGTCAGPIYE